MCRRVRRCAPWSASRPVRSRFWRPPQSCSTAASSRPLRSGGACSICWRPGIRASPFASSPDTSRIWRWPRGRRSSVAIASRERKSASRPARPVPLYRARDIDAGGARLQSAHESVVRRSTGDGGLPIRFAANHVAGKSSVAAVEFFFYTWGLEAVSGLNPRAELKALSSDRNVG